MITLTFFFFMRTDGRVCDYVVDGIESRMPANSGHYYNITPGSLTPGSTTVDSHQQSSTTHRPNNLVSSVNSIGMKVVFFLCF